MTEDEDLQPLKQYYSIQEVAALLGVNASLLRYWEGEFPMLNPRKNRKGNRMYTRKDMDLLEQIKYLLKERKFTIKGALSHLTHKGSPLPAQVSLRSKLQLVREGLMDLKKSLDQETP